MAAFTTGGAANAPSAVTGPAASISAGAASLTGTVNAHGQATAYTFEFGTSLSFGSISAVANAGSSTADLAVSATLTGLAPNATYFYRLVATNATGTTTGAVMAITTTGVPTAPVVATGPASALPASSATLSGTVNREGQQTSFAFEYGPTTAFGSLSPVDNAGAVGATESVSLPVTGLSPGTTYLYRIVATNAIGTSVGAVAAFTTP